MIFKFTNNFHDKSLGYLMPYLLYNSILKLKISHPTSIKSNGQKNQLDSTP
jgi:hypothetical protein